MTNEVALQMENNIYICSPRVTEWEIVRQKCPTCKKRRRILIEYYEWYSPLASCLSCGDRWSDGERLPRPFYRNWREDEVKKLKRRLAYLCENFSAQQGKWEKI
jgi:hypothetical protein